MMEGHRRLSILTHAELPDLEPAEQIIISMPTIQQRRWTEAEVRRLIEESPGTAPRFELVDGELLVTPAPSGMHQRLVLALATMLNEYVRAHALGEVRSSLQAARVPGGGRTGVQDR